jgi:hypothetical protein
MTLYKISYGERGIEYASHLSEKIIVDLWGHPETTAELIDYYDERIIFHLHDARDFRDKPLTVVVMPIEVDLPD